MLFNNLKHNVYFGAIQKIFAWGSCHEYKLHLNYSVLWSPCSPSERKNLLRRFRKSENSEFDIPLPYAPLKRIIVK